MIPELLYALDGNNFMLTVNRDSENFEHTHPPLATWSYDYPSREEYFQALDRYALAATDV